MNIPSNDTIAAMATPPGIGGIAVIRISGRQALTVLRGVFRPGKLRPEAGGSSSSTHHEIPPGAAGEFAFIPRHMHYGSIAAHDGAILDEVLAVFMPGPASFTGEDVAEIHCHGGYGVSTAILEAVQNAGARLALPGEFSKRAFMNGRLDLAQAEAIAEMISAPTREGARLAAAKLGGAFSGAIRRLRASLEALRTQCILAVDFPDEDAESLAPDAFSHAITETVSGIDALLQSFDRARLWREGALVVLAGKVNAGKSSLLNALAGLDRAIVSPAPGTTRDYIEETLHIQGLLVRLVDTAGLRQGGDVIEEEGIRRSRGLADEADVLLFVLTAGEPLSQEERDFLEKREPLAREGRLVLLLNKADLLADSDSKNALIQSGGQDGDGGSSGSSGPYDAWKDSGSNDVSEAEQDRQARNLLAAMGVSGEALHCPCCRVSAKKGLGMDAVSSLIFSALTGQRGGRTSPTLGESGAFEFAPNLRQGALLRQARDEMAALQSAFSEGHPPDILAVHLDAAVRLLGEITDVSDNETLMNAIFANFCIGK